MMSEESKMDSVFQFILSNKGITAPIEKLEIEGVMDEPGLHWSNPGVKQISVYANGKRHQFVLKRLGDHSKREILVYRFLSAKNGFPIPRLYHDVYDDNTKEFWMVIERCVGRDFPNLADFYEQCGLLLARIHASFWDRINTLPEFFRTKTERVRLGNAIDRLSRYLESLSKQDIMNLDEELGISIDDLHSVVHEVDREGLPVSLETARCLIHGSFHSPEIMWREVSGEYIPVGIDWESSRIGIPAEDLAFGIPTLLAKGENDMFSNLVDTYLSELKAHGINLDRDKISTSIRHEAHIKLMSSVIPFVLQTYLKVRDNESYTKWCQWLKQDIPKTIRFVQSEVESGHIYDEYKSR